MPTASGRGVAVARSERRRDRRRPRADARPPTLIDCVSRAQALEPEQPAPLRRGHDGHRERRPVVDEYETPFGIRTIKFDPDDGFLLNGEHVPINGVCNHHDLGALGAALNVRALERQLEIIKEMGCNAIRTSHNPPAPELLDLCDRMGFLVMDEAFDAWQVRRRSGTTISAVRRLAREGPAGAGPPRPQPPLRDPLEHRQRNRRAGKTAGTPARSASPTSSRRRPDAPGDRGAATSSQAGFNGFQKPVDVFGYNYKPYDYADFRESNPTIPLDRQRDCLDRSSRGEYFFPVERGQAQGRADFQVSSYDLYAPRWAMAARRGVQGPG